ncbi:4775_t:CDS:2, partial [Diversispora eburnea]
MIIICLLGIFLFPNKISCQQKSITTITSIPETIPTTVPTESIPIAADVPGQNASIYETYLDPRVYAALISTQPAIPDDGTKPTDKCVYVSTPRPNENKSVSWDCEAGYYCLGSSNSSKFPCTDGFYCPENTQPNYCCEGYYCENPKTIKLCPEGTVNPLSCHYMAFCPPGSSFANKYLVGVLVAAIILLILILFQIKKKADYEKNKKYKRLLVEPRFENSERTLDRVSQTFDIEFEDLSLVLPSVSGSLKHGRTCAIMGPSGAGKTTLVSLLTGKVSKQLQKTYWIRTSRRELTIREILV